jgi:hypothetical protein
MSVDRFDHLARLLAQGTSRRQILKGFAAGLGASLFSTFRIGAPGQQQIAQAAAPAQSAGGNFLPYVISTLPAGPAICAVNSYCINEDVRVNCSASEDTECRCILDTEGTIRCGGIPPELCDAQRCKASSDCANLGAGYFCETVGSGCCDDGEQRCIPPCPTEAPCPDDLICGAKCCAPGATCQNGICVDPVNGTWTGTLTYEDQSIGIRFIFSRRLGQIDGRILLQDPVSNKFLETGPVTGTYRSEYSNLNLDSGSFVFGNFEGESFTGDFTFADFNDEPGITAKLTTQRA